MDETLGEPGAASLPEKPPRKKVRLINILMALVGIGVIAATWAMGTLVAMLIVPMMGLKEVAACTVGGFLAGWIGRSWVKENDWR